MEGLTAHIMVRNEPLVFYSVMSVYNRVDKILLWDTGSDDHTLADIHEACALDKQNKIDFRKVAIETDERFWTNSNWKREQKKNRGKRGTGWVRQKMIDETDTDFFLIVDGDEIWYDKALIHVHEFIRTARHDQHTICGRVALRWFSDMNTWFKLTASTRVFKTDRVVMMQASPGEMHMDKMNRQHNSLEKGRATVVIPIMNPYAHYETMLKPWRRSVPQKDKKPWSKDKWPEIIMQHPKYLARWNAERAAKKNPSKADSVPKKLPIVPDSVRAKARKGEWLK